MWGYLWSVSLDIPLHDTGEERGLVGRGVREGAKGWQAGFSSLAHSATFCQALAGLSDFVAFWSQVLRCSVALIIIYMRVLGIRELTSSWLSVLPYVNVKCFIHWVLSLYGYLSPFIAAFLQLLSYISTIAPMHGL